jgi:hypothetical protein
MAFSANNPNAMRCTMKVSQAVDFHLQYHRAYSKKMPSKHVGSSFPVSLPDPANVILPSISTEEVLMASQSKLTYNHRFSRRL